jgi:uncharacterized Tic20 family protein
MVLGLQDWDFAEGVLETLAKKIDKPTFNSTYLLGYFLGFMIILILISLLEIYLIRIQKRTGFWITFALDFLITISSSFIFILFPITLLILGLSKSARSYFNKDIYLMAESD